MRFYDTNCFMENLSGIVFPFAISQYTLLELEDIKTNRNKTDEVRFAARDAIQFLNNAHGKYSVVCEDDQVCSIAEKFGLDCRRADVKICCSALHFQNKTNDTVLFTTHDISCRNIAFNILGLQVEWFEVAEDTYTGFLKVCMTQEEMAHVYENQYDNCYNLLINEYLIIEDENHAIVDSLRWDGNKFQTTKIGNIKSDMFGSVKPYKGDVYQQCLLNSFINNKITMVRGRAGTGKTWCALGYLLYLLEKRKIDKIIFFTNTQPTINTARLGFYPGSRDEKLLESSIGNILSSKFGDSFMVEKYIAEGKILLIPMCDIRGYDTTNMNAGVLITEAQNLNVELMKLALQRIGEDSICIIDGDCDTQVDSDQYSGSKNGMRRLSQVFRGHDFYGEIELQNIYRSKIAALADKM